jgi:hypothetical protein
MSVLARILGTAAICFAVLAQSARAADPAPGTTTVTGRLACAMCVLKMKDVKSCVNVLVTSEGGKEIVYALAENAVTRAYDMKACEKAVPVKVTGKVTESGGKRTIDPSSIEKT